jgi:RNA polymerase sigma-70 factor (ECF subfamily)
MDATERLDEVRIREFLAADYPRLVAAVRLAAGDTAAAEDAVAEALARAWERADRGDTIANLPAWVMRVALNLATNRWRRLGAERRARERVAHAHGDDAPGPDDRLDIERALQGLSRREREVTVLRYYLGFNVSETAGTLGVSEGTVKTLLYRARHELAAALGEHDEEEVDDRAGHR